jgi:hypothetical protein
MEQVRASAEPDTFQNGLDAADLVALFGWTAESSQRTKAARFVARL